MLTALTVQAVLCSYRRGVLSQEDDRRAYQMKIMELDKQLKMDEEEATSVEVGPSPSETTCTMHCRTEH